MPYKHEDLLWVVEVVVDVVVVARSLIFALFIIVTVVFLFYGGETKANKQPHQYECLRKNCKKKSDRHEHLYFF